MIDRSFGKKYKLSSKLEIERVFQRGETIKSHPFMCRFLVTEWNNESTFKIVVSAPKRTYKTAVERNRIKRVCREGVRLNKHILETWLKENDKHLALFVIYQGSKELKFQQTEKKINQLFKSLVTKLNKTAND